MLRKKKRKTSPRRHKSDPHAGREATRYEQPIASREYILEVITEADRPVNRQGIEAATQLVDRMSELIDGARARRHTDDGPPVDDGDAADWTERGFSYPMAMSLTRYLADRRGFGRLGRRGRRGVLWPGYHVRTDDHLRPDDDLCPAGEGPQAARRLRPVWPGAPERLLRRHRLRSLRTVDAEVRRVDAGHPSQFVRRARILRQLA